MKNQILFNKLIMKLQYRQKGNKIWLILMLIFKPAIPKNLYACFHKNSSNAFSPALVYFIKTKWAYIASIH